MSGRTAGSTRAIAGSRRTTSSSAAARPASWRSSAATARSSGGSVPTSSSRRNFSAIRQIIGQHHPHIIPKGLPGAGICWCSTTAARAAMARRRRSRPTARAIHQRAGSRVLEINPVTLELVWSYTGPRFFSTNISGAQRLPNGNTLITEGAPGRLLEVTSDRRIVWEYIYPVFGGAERVECRLPRLSSPVRLDSADRTAGRACGRAATDCRFPRALTRVWRKAKGAQRSWLRRRRREAHRRASSIRTMSDSSWTCSMTMERPSGEMSKSCTPKSPGSWSTGVPPPS